VWDSKPVTIILIINIIIIIIIYVIIYGAGAAPMKPFYMQ
jgi:hypothetical protein